MPRWETHDLEGVAHGFREAAEIVAAAVENRARDSLYLPLQYLWRHHIELILKANIQMLGGIAGTGRAIPVGHDLLRLYGEFADLAHDVLGDEGEEDRVAGREALRTIVDLEPSPDASRYPGSTQGMRYPRPERVDLKEFQRAALAVASLLRGTHDYLAAMVDAMDDVVGS